MAVRRHFLSDLRGTVMVEYVVILTVVALGCSLALVGLGAPLYRMYLVQRAWVSLPVP